MLKLILAIAVVLPLISGCEKEEVKPKNPQSHAISSSAATTNKHITDPSNNSSSSSIDSSNCIVFTDTIANSVLTDTLSGGTFIDERDGKTYKYTIIGNQIWMAENLNYVADSSKCYGNDPKNCYKYGRLYNWNAAMKLCPNGWHLPIYDEWKTLMNFVGNIGMKGENLSYPGKKLKTTSGWKSEKGKPDNGTDEFGFSALPGGFSGSFERKIGEEGSWWSASESNDSNTAIAFYITTCPECDYNIVCENHGSPAWCDMDSDIFEKNDNNSVRCVYNLHYDNKNAIYSPSSYGKVSTAIMLCNLVEYDSYSHYCSKGEIIAKEEFIDERDGKIYKTVSMPDGKIWFAENLSYETEDSWCYNDDDSNCEKYGRLYSWVAAVKSCPNGWRLPSDSEWEALIESVGGSDVAGKKLKSKIVWNGTDEFGFSILPSGYLYRGIYDDILKDKFFYNIGNYGNWWSATNDDINYANYIYIDSGSNNFGKNSLNKLNGSSVRCVRDE